MRAIHNKLMGTLLQLPILMSSTFLACSQVSAETPELMKRLQDEWPKTLQANELPFSKVNTGSLASFAQARMQPSPVEWVSLVFADTDGPKGVLRLPPAQIGRVALPSPGDLEDEKVILLLDWLSISYDARPVSVRKLAISKLNFLSVVFDLDPQTSNQCLDRLTNTPELELWRSIAEMDRESLIAGDLSITDALVKLAVAKSFRYVIGDRWEEIHHGQRTVIAIANCDIGQPGRTDYWVFHGRQLFYNVVLIDKRSQSDLAKDENRKEDVLRIHKSIIDCALRTENCRE